MPDFGVLDPKSFQAKTIVTWPVKLLVNGESRVLLVPIGLHEA